MYSLISYQENINLLTLIFADFSLVIHTDNSCLKRHNWSYNNLSFQHLLKIIIIIKKADKRTGRKRVQSFTLLLLVFISVISCFLWCKNIVVIWITATDIFSLSPFSHVVLLFQTRTWPSYFNMKCHWSHCSVLAEEYPPSSLPCSSSDLSCGVALGSTGCQFTGLRPGLSGNAQGHSYGLSGDLTLVVPSVWSFHIQSACMSS